MIGSLPFAFNSFILNFETIASRKTTLRQREVSTDFAHFIGSSLLHGDFLIVGIMQDELDSPTSLYTGIPMLLMVKDTSHVYSLSRTIDAAICVKPHHGTH